MKPDFWISVLVAIPLAIIANLLAPRVREWLEQRAERSTHRKNERTYAEIQTTLSRLRSDLEQVVEYHSDC